MEEKLHYLYTELGFTSMFRAEDLKVIFLNIICSICIIFLFQELINKSYSYSEYYFQYINLSNNTENVPFDKMPDFDKSSEAFECIIFSKNMITVKKIKISSLMLHSK